MEMDVVELEFQLSYWIDKYNEAEEDMVVIDKKIGEMLSGGSDLSKLLCKISEATISDDVKETKEEKRKRSKTPPVRRKHNDDNVVDIHCFDHIDKKYDIIIVDPPWDYKRKTGSGVAANWYDSLKIEQLKKLPVGKLAAENCLLVFWITNPMDIYYREILEAWGFEYKNWGFVWLKVNRKDGEPRILLGNYTRTCTEALYLSTKKPEEGEHGSEQIKSPRKKKGKPPMWVEFQYEEDSVGGVGILAARKGETPLINRESRKVSSIIQTFFDSGELQTIRTNLPGGKGKHSIKPMGSVIDRLKIFFGDNYEKMNKIELFSRTNYEGWDSWGKEAGAIDEDGNRVEENPKDDKNSDIRDHLIMKKKRKILGTI